MSVIPLLRNKPALGRVGAFRQPAPQIDESLWQDILALMPTAKPEQLPYVAGEVQGGVKVVIVDGDRVKLEHGQAGMDYVEGANAPELKENYGQSFIPDDEVWIDDRIDPADWPFIAYHEVVERRDMLENGTKYAQAHTRANAQEKVLRQCAAGGQMHGKSLGRVGAFRKGWAAGKAEFTESEHPRDEVGKFTEGAGSGGKLEKKPSRAERSGKERKLIESGFDQSDVDEMDDKEIAANYRSRFGDEPWKSPQREAMEKKLAAEGFEQADFDDMTDKDVVGDYRSRFGEAAPAADDAGQSAQSEEGESKDIPSTVQETVAAAKDAGIRAGSIDQNAPIDKQLYDLGRIDVEVLDDIYDQLAAHGHTESVGSANEVFRSLDNSFRSAKTAAEGGDPKPADKITAVFESQRANFASVARALKNMGMTKQADFYSTYGPKVIAAAERYALEHYAKPGKSWSMKSLGRVNSFKCLIGTPRPGPCPGNAQLEQPQRKPTAHEQWEATPRRTRMPRDEVLRAGIPPFISDPDDRERLAAFAPKELHGWRQAVAEHNDLKTTEEKMRHRGKLEDAYKLLRRKFREMHGGKALLGRVKSFRSVRLYKGDVLQPSEILDREGKSLAQPIAAGLCVKASDTGRVLMLQRKLSDDDPASGKFEFPGGHLKQGEAPRDGAIREWQEETGIVLPQSVEHVTDWPSADGRYILFVCVIPSEEELQINGDSEARRVLDSDHSDGERHEVTAWFLPEDLQGMPALREEIHDMPLDMIDRAGKSWQGKSGTCERGQTAAATGCTPANGEAGTNAPKHESAATRAIAKAKAVIVAGQQARDKITAHLDAHTNQPGVKQAKEALGAALGAVKAVQDKLYATMEARYGKNGARAIFITAQLTGANPAIFPAWFVAIPGSTLLAQLPLMGIAEVVLQTSRGIKYALGKSDEGKLAGVDQSVAELLREVYGVFFDALRPHKEELAQALRGFGRKSLPPEPGVVETGAAVAQRVYDSR